MKSERAQLLAFYLPQFHPIAENDAWWGKGFTEWTNVVQAKPLFPGHYQPHVPADLGFYDLRVPEVRQAQADMASAYGISGFCYYHYWFKGRRLLDRPFAEVLDSRQPDFPFCLCWANENWTRRWDGNENDVLLSQEYCEDDDRAHLRWLSKAFQDRRYIRIDGRPLFLIYRANALPNPTITVSNFRDEARSLGVGELFLGRVESHPDERGDPAAMGFDAAIEFQPNWLNLGEPMLRGWPASSLARRIGMPYDAVDFKYIYKSNRIFDYEAVVNRMLARPEPSYRRFPSVTLGWDNTARRSSNRTIFRDATPAIFERWLSTVLLRQSSSAETRTPFVFVNAWNEWAEGVHLEPCLRWGHQYLEAVRRAIEATG